jgi:hypothetical protein
LLLLRKHGAKAVIVLLMMTQQRPAKRSSSVKCLDGSFEAAVKTARAAVVVVKAAAGIAQE